MAKSRIRKFRESFLYAGRGLRLCITGERNFRVHMTAAFYVTAAAVMGHVTSTEAAVLCLCFGLTMGAELMNTAVERLCDKTARGYDRMVRDAKDIAAAAVFCVCGRLRGGGRVHLPHARRAGGRSAFFSRAALARDGLSCHRSGGRVVRFLLRKEAVIAPNGDRRPFFLPLSRGGDLPPFRRLAQPQAKPFLTVG